jgi:hypothetical protein
MDKQDLVADPGGIVGFRCDQVGHRHTRGTPPGYLGLHEAERRGLEQQHGGHQGAEEPDLALVGRQGHELDLRPGAGGHL